MIFKVIPEGKQQVVKEKDADNIRKVLCTSCENTQYKKNTSCQVPQLRKHQDSLENKSNCFHQDITLSVHCLLENLLKRF